MVISFLQHKQKENGTYNSSIDFASSSTTSAKTTTMTTTTATTTTADTESPGKATETTSTTRTASSSSYSAVVTNANAPMAATTATVRNARSGKSDNLASLLLGFLELYGKKFDYQNTGITITNGGYATTVFLVIVCGEFIAVV
jgi:DNA polymerase sigma